MLSNIVVNVYPIQMSGRMVKEACKAAAGSMAELVEEKARYGGKEEQEDGGKDAKKGEDYYEKTIQFECSICGLCEMCQYLGRKPPFTKHLLEGRGGVSGSGEREVCQRGLGQSSSRGTRRESCSDGGRESS